VEINIPLTCGATLEIDSRRGSSTNYPTARLQKGFALLQDGRSLIEEGIGFGLPVVKRGNQTVFPGHMELQMKANDLTCVLDVQYQMDLEERIALPGKRRIESKLVYQLKNGLADLHRRIPVLRGFLTAASNRLRRLLAMETIFAEVTSFGTITADFTIYSNLGRIFFKYDTSRLRKNALTEIIIMNEQGARTFDVYQDSMGTYLKADEIGTWDEVKAEEATFISVIDHLAFSLKQVEGARLFRGRELIGSRLAWTGFGYSLPATAKTFCYELKIRRYP